MLVDSGRRACAAVSAESTCAPTPSEVTMAGLRRDPWLGYTGRRLRRHLHWLRSQGLARLVAEDELNPVDRATKAASKWRWRLTHRARPPGGTAVFLVGVQRSGTNMLVR